MNKEKLMKIAIHKSTWGFSSDWIEYCVRHNIEYKIVNCYSSDIIKQIDDCDVLLWHHHHMLAKDTLFAKQLLFSVNQAGKVVFPDFYTNWHFDDKVGQKYLLEAIKAPFAPTWVFYDKNEALEWLQRATFPMVFKLRGGSGSSNVRLVKTHSHAKKLVKKAFGRGFSPYNKVGDIKEQIRKFTWEKDRVVCFLKSLRRLVFSTLFARTIGYHKGYILFQKYYEKNKFDIRVIVIGERAFAIKRLVRKNDFRASGSGSIMYDKNEIDERCVVIGFLTKERLNAQCVAFDFVYDKYKRPVIIEINYGFAHNAYHPCPGYWDRQMVWHSASFNSADWIMEEVIQRVVLK